MLSELFAAPPTSPGHTHSSHLCVSLLYSNPVFSTPEGLPGPLLSISLCSFNPQMPPYNFTGFSSAPPCLPTCWRVGTGRIQRKEAHLCP